MKRLKFVFSTIIALSLTAANISYAAADTSSPQSNGAYYSADITLHSDFHYVHDPRLNPKAMEDVCVDPNAIYGFSPNPNSERLGSFTFIDWSDAEAVESVREERIAYHNSIKQMYTVLDEMTAEGKSDEEIARTISTLRNDIRTAADSDDPEMLAAMKESNLKRYGNENGPTPDQLYEKYGSWKTVTEKAFSVNSGMDVCLGLYDDYYELYIAMGQILPESETAATREYAISAFVQSVNPLFSEDDTLSLEGFDDSDTISPWYTKDISNAVAHGIIAGYEDGTLQPQKRINRVEAMVILARCLPETGSAMTTREFADVPLWARDDIASLVSAGIAMGYDDGTLGAYDDLTVEQVKLLTERTKSFIAE